MYVTKSYEVAPTLEECFRSIAIKFISNQFDNPEEIVDFFMAHLSVKDMDKVQKLMSVDRRGTKIYLGSRKALVSLAMSFGNALNHAYYTQKTAKITNYSTTIAPDMIAVN